MLTPLVNNNKVLKAILIASLLLQEFAFPDTAEARRRRPNSSWQPIQRTIPNNSIKWPTTNSSTFSPAPIETFKTVPSQNRSFSRSLDWQNSNRFLPFSSQSKEQFSQKISPMQLPSPEEGKFTMYPAFQLSSNATGTVGPITGARPQSLIQPSQQSTPTTLDNLNLTSTKFKLIYGTNHHLKNLEFRETNIRDIIRALAQLANINLMIANDIQGNVTIMFRDIYLEDAFAALLKSQNLAFSWDGSILQVFLAANAPTSQFIFQIKNTNAASIKPIIDRMLTPNRGSSEVDARLNAILVRDTPDVIDKIALLLPQLDVQETTVEVTSRPLTEVFYLNYADATSLITPIQTIVPTATIQSFSSSQASQAAAGGTTGGRMDMMIITDTQANLDRIRELIEKLDIAPIQVIIDAHIYEIDLNQEEKLGINWQKYVPVPGTTNREFEVSISPEEANAGGTGVFRFGSLDVNQFRAILAMLKTNSFAKVLSNPVLTTLNNRPANITVGQAIPYVSASILDPNTGTINNQISQANANITLQVTPSVTGNDEVFLQINPSISSVLGFTTLGGNSTPNLSNRSASTQVIVKNNHTIVIGGMIKTDKNESISKVPYLGDLPGIGRLFQKKTVKEIRTELIIFITPHIVRNHGGNSTVSDAMKKEFTPRLSLTP